MVMDIIGARKTYGSEVPQAPPALVNTHIAIIDQAGEVGQGTAGQRTIAIPPFKYADEPPLGVSLREETSVAREAVIE